MGSRNSEPYKAAKSGTGSCARMGEYYLPTGVLTVTVIEVTKLQGRTQVLGRYDPFVKILVGEQTAFSDVKRNAGSEAVWNETFEFPLKREKNFFTIKLQVFDRNIMLAHSLMGEVSLDLAHRPECQTSEPWNISLAENLSLEREEGLGQIRFSVSFQEKTAAEMLLLDLKDQKGKPPARTSAAGNVAGKGGRVVLGTIGLVANAIGIVTFTKVE